MAAGEHICWLNLTFVHLAGNSKPGSRSKGKSLCGIGLASIERGQDAGTAHVFVLALFRHRR